MAKKKSSKNNTKHSICLFPLVSFILVPIVTIIYYFIFTRYSFIKIDKSHVLKLDWKDGVKSIVSQGFPAILLGSPSAHWRANSFWTDEYLQKNIKKFVNVHQSKSALFVHYDQNLELSKDYSKQYKTTDMSTNVFFKRFKNETEFIYCNSILQELSASLSKDVEPSDEFVVYNTPLSSAIDHSRDYAEKMIKIWLGNKGVTANMHYDAVHNFFHQVRGRKKFTLLPPLAWKHLSVFSRLHPSHRQCQTSFLSIPLEIRKQIKTVVLEPNEMLYLPPFWFHHVETLDSSISVNIWSNSFEINQFQLLLENPLPYLKKFEQLNLIYDSNSNMFSLQCFLSRLIKVVHGDIPSYIKILKKQWSFAKENHNNFYCGNINKEKGKEIRQRINKYVTEINDKIFVPMSSGIRDILLGSFIESLSAQYMHANVVIIFLSQCII